VNAWTKARTTQTDNPRQLEWASNVVEYVSYVFKATTVRAGTKKGTGPPCLMKEVPILGPRFLPPGYTHLQNRISTPLIEPKTAYLKPINIVHPLYYPDIAKCPECCSENTSWQGWTATGHREVHGVRRKETALGYQLECKDCKPEKGVRSHNAAPSYCFATTNTSFWKKTEHWEIPREYGLPIKKPMLT
jgi:hypothetical protein